MMNANILVVEDESIVAEDIQNKLKKFGYTVLASVSSGEEALQKAADNHPDLVLMDIKIKGNMDGVEVAKEIYARFDIPVVYLTAYVDENTLERAKITEPFGYIIKPFKESDLRTTIEITLYRHQREKKLKEREQWLTTVLKSIGDAVITTDSKGKVTFINPVAEALTGWQQKDAIGRDGTEVFNISDEETPAVMENSLTKALQEDIIVSVPKKTILMARNGIQIPIDDSVAPIKDDKGNILGEVLVFRDITLAKQIEEERQELLQAVQQLNTHLERQVQARTIQLQKSLGFEAVLKRITDKVRDSLDESQILQAAVRELALMLNVGSCKTALYSIEEETATICYEYTTSMPPSQERVVQIANFPEIYEPLLQGQCFQFCPIAKPVRNRVAILACPIFDDQGVLGDLWLLHRQEHGFNNLEIRLVQQVANQCAIAIRQARLYHTAQAQVKELEKLNHLKDDFLSTVSHELRTPISNMKMAIQMLKLASPSERTQRYLEILQAECAREAELINDLLDLQRLEAASYPTFLAQSVSLQDWLPSLIEPFRSRIQERQLRLHVDISSELPTIVSDLSSLERILAELLNNACKYTPPGEQITVVAFSEAGRIELQVRNSGTEIPAGELSRIFEKFYRIPSGDRWKQGGTGLGLALVQRLAEHLGGVIRVESAYEQTSFIVNLPVSPPTNRVHC